MTVMIGATMTAAEAAAMASTPSLNPRFLVFHFCAAGIASFSPIAVPPGFGRTTAFCKPFKALVSSIIIYLSEIEPLLSALLKRTAIAS
jgi:hypothetical protein